MRDWDEVRRWRKARRAELTAERLAIPRGDRARWDGAVTALLEEALPAPGRLRIGFYWPFKGEYDLRALARSLRDRGARLCLPVVVERARPLAFREWWPGMRMAPGVWGIPAPAEGDWVLPDVLLVPLLGFDGSGYRLGYGGGYYATGPCRRCPPSLWRSASATSRCGWKPSIRGRTTCPWT